MTPPDREAAEESALPEDREERDPTELVALTNRSMRARRHPFAIVAWWAWQTIVSLVAVWPIYSVAHAAFGRHPDGDAIAWAPGALDLADLIGRAMAGDPWVSALPVHVVMVLFAGAVLGHIPLAATIAAIAFARRNKTFARPDQLARRARLAFWPMISVFLITTLVEGAVFGVGASIVSQVGSAIAPGHGEARAAEISVLLGGLVALLVFVVGVIQDLARVAIVRFRVGALGAIRIAWRTFGRGRAAIVWSWMWRAAAGLVPIAIGAFVADRLGGEGGFSLLILALVHQGVVCVRVAFRASWLAKATRRVDALHEAPTP